MPDLVNLVVEMAEVLEEYVDHSFRNTESISDKAANALRKYYRPADVTEINPAEQFLKLGGIKI